MSGWNNRYIPYPLLAPWTHDYDEGIDFGIDIPHSTRDDRDNINLTIRYELGSEYLKELIAARKAKYMTVVECGRTFRRLVLSPSASESEDVFVEPAADFSDSLSLVPYVVATCGLNGFLSDEHAEEIRLLNPQGFRIGAWSMLARGAEQRVDIDANSNPNSVIDLVGSADVEDGAFNIDLSDNRIKIYVSHRDFQVIDAFRRGKTPIDPERASLVPSLYMYAVVEALRNLYDHEDRLWLDTIRHALEKRGISADAYELRDNAIKYAQTLMDNPIGTMLQSFQKDED